MEPSNVTIPGPESHVYLKRSETLTLTFTQDSIIQVQNGGAFQPNLALGKHDQGSEQFIADDDSNTVLIKYKDDDRNDASKTKMHTVTIGSGLALFEELEKELKGHGEKLDSVFCTCWPCAKELLQLLLNSKTFPIPPPAKVFLNALLKAGDLAHFKFCEHTRD